VGRRGGAPGDAEVVDGDVLGDGGGDGYLWRRSAGWWERGKKGGGVGGHLVAVLARPHVHDALLDAPDPGRQCAVEQRVQGHGRGGVGLGGLEAQRVVPVEAGGAEGEGGVAEGEAHVAEGVGLREVEGVEVVGDCVVGGVLQVWEGAAGVSWAP